MNTVASASTESGGFNGSCAEYIVGMCYTRTPGEADSQLCVLSLGFDLEGVAAEMIANEVARDAARIFCVVLPDGLSTGTIARVAGALREHLNRKAALEAVENDCPAVTVHTIDEGTSTKERCAAFQHGGVIVSASRMLCADLLHRRLSTSLVGLALLLFPYGPLGAAVRETVTPSLAFCVEMLLRGGLAGAGARPRVVLLSDNPSLMQYLVQRHQVGLERFTHQMHIGDVQLFPRFRLDFIEHFEALAQHRPLKIDRVVVNVSPSTRALDGVLRAILLEVLAEVQSLEQRLQQRPVTSPFHTTATSEEMTGVSSRPLHHRGASPSALAAALDDDDAAHLAPRARPRLESTSTHASNIISNSGNAGSAQTGRPDADNAATAPSATGANDAAGEIGGALRYVYKPWRDRSNFRHIRFRFLDEDICLDAQFNELDSDLTVALKANEPSWPYRNLTESLLDVRRLRRALRNGSNYDFLFALDSVLQLRTPQQGRYGASMGASAAVPNAPWTLSTHFQDVVMLATQRIGQVLVTEEPVPDEGRAGRGRAKVKANGPRPACGGGDDGAVIDLISDDDKADDDVEVVCATSSPPSASVATRKVMRLVPNTDESCYESELVFRLVLSWCRDTRRKLARETTVHTEGPPALLLVTFGRHQLGRYVERLVHSYEEYHRLQINNFLAEYRERCGIGVQLQPNTPSDAMTDQHDTSSAAPATTKRTSNRPSLATWLARGGGERTGSRAAASTTTTGADEDSDEDGDDGVDGGDEGGNEEEEDNDSSSGGVGGKAARGGARGRSTTRAQRVTQGGGPPLPSVLFSQPLAQHTVAACPGTMPGVVAGGISRASRDMNCGHTNRDVPSASPPPNYSLHNILLSQAPFGPGDTALLRGHNRPVDDPRHPRHCAAFEVERLGAGLAMLVSGAMEAETPADPLGQRPRVVVVDGAFLRPVDFVRMMQGTHPWLRTVDVAVGALRETVEQGETGGGGGEHDNHADAAREESDEATANGPPAVVRRVVLTRQNLHLLRTLELTQDVLDATVLSKVKIQLVTSVFSETDFKKAVEHEREAFQSLAHAKATLTGTLLVDRAALRRTEEALASVTLRARDRRGQPQGARRPPPSKMFGADALQDRGSAVVDATMTPLIVFDEREFRSTLPYELYCKGMDLVPLTLTTADYVLSPQYAVERKSVPDYNQSLQSGRVFHQLAALSRKYEQPILLLEFNRMTPFRLSYTTAWQSTTEVGAMGVVYARTARLVVGYPRLCVLWARDAAHAASMLATLKHGPAHANVNPGSALLTGNLGSGDSVEAESEMAHYAARVLSRFPGVTSSNVTQIMQLCGSLAGLATIAKSSLQGAIGEEAGEQLYTFLHEPFSEEVE